MFQEEPPRPRLPEALDDLLTRIIILKPDAGLLEPTHSAWALRNSAAATTIVSQRVVEHLGLTQIGLTRICIELPHRQIIECPIFRAGIGCPDLFPSVMLRHVIARPGLDLLGADGLVGADLLNPN